MIIPQTKKIGVWGFGITGKAAADFFYRNGYSLAVMDNRTLDDHEQTWLTSRNIPYYPQLTHADFFTACDYIIPSAGIDIRSYLPLIQEKLLLELDIFYAHASKPIIAITGTVGKTSVTTLTSQLAVHYGYRVATGGNIGIPTLTLLDQDATIDYYILEVSDVQLKYCRQFAPYIGVFLNFSPNHLNWHNNIADYFAAKMNLFARQQTTDIAIVSTELFSLVRIHCVARLYAYDICDNNINITSDYPTYDLVKQLPTITMEANWYAIITILQNIGCTFENFLEKARICTLPPDRLELVTTHHNITFYNDSKSTTVTSTRAAIDFLKSRKTILLLGGLGKGVDRSELIRDIYPHVQAIICFGGEYAQLIAWCSAYPIFHEGYPTLEQAFQSATIYARPGDVILLSPAGSSWDAFKNYHERGNTFKALINDWKQKTPLKGL